MLMLHESPCDLLKNGVVLGGISPKQLAEFLRAKIQLILLKYRVLSRCFAKLFIFGQFSVFSIVVEIQSLTTSIQSDNRLLRLKVFQLYSCIFV